MGWGVKDSGGTDESNSGMGERKVSSRTRTRDGRAQDKRRVKGETGSGRVAEWQSGRERGREREGRGGGERERVSE